MKENKYKLSDFDDFLLAEDISVKDMGWLMIYNSFKVSEMDLDDLAYLKIELSSKKYFPIIRQYSTFYRVYYFNNTAKILSWQIDNKLKRFSGNDKSQAFYKAKKLIFNEQ